MSAWHICRMHCMTSHSGWQPDCGVPLCVIASAVYKSSCKKCTAVLLPSCFSGCLCFTVALFTAGWTPLLLEHTLPSLCVGYCMRCACCQLLPRETSGEDEPQQYGQCQRSGANLPVDDITDHCGPVIAAKASLVHLRSARRPVIHQWPSGSVCQQHAIQSSSLFCMSYEGSRSACDSPVLPKATRHPRSHRCRVTP